MTRPPSMAYRKRILRRDRLCSYCQISKSTTVDHIIPRSDGGGNRESNLCGCCYKCNQRKSDKTVFEAGFTLHPSDRLIYACEADGFSAHDYNLEGFVKPPLPWLLTRRM